MAGPEAADFYPALTFIDILTLSPQAPFTQKFPNRSPAVMGSTLLRFPSHLLTPVLGLEFGLQVHHKE